LIGCERVENQNDDNFDAEEVKSMPTQSTIKTKPKSTADKTLTLTRTFDAPRDLVWKVWVDPEHAKQWWGPQGFTAPVVELATSAGGAWRAQMRAPDGKALWQHGVLREIVPPERLRYTFIWDEHPEEELLVTVDFVARDGKTEMNFKQTGFSSIEERDSHRDGWSQSFDRLAAYLKRVGSHSSVR
jgi:uncharacterized protein YndB with AHSA1/START domain